MTMLENAEKQVVGAAVAYLRDPTPETLDGLRWAVLSMDMVKSQTGIDEALKSARNALEALPPL